MYVIVGAFGIQGEAILYYLLERTDANILTTDILDVPPHLKDTYNKYFGRLAHVVGKGDCFSNRLDPKAGKVTVISCLPTEFNYNLTKLCAIWGYNMVDLGGDTSIARSQFEFDNDAKRNKVSIVPDCGLAPGIVASLADHYVKMGWSNIEIFCGGIPKYPEPPFSYAKMFHEGGVTKECSGYAQIVRDGKFEFKPARSCRTLVPVPAFGVLEAAITSGGLSFAVDDIPAKNLRYRTLRYPGHWDYLDKYIMTQPDPTDVLKHMLRKTNAGNPDVIILIFELSVADGAKRRYQYYWEYRGDLGFGNGLSAMAQATGFVVGAVAHMINDGVVKHGVVGMNEVNAMEIIRRVRKIDMQFSTMPIKF
jgi:lysine 6-dehydrogenase